MTVETNLNGEEASVITSLEHSAIGVNLARHLANYVSENRLGRVFNSQTTFKVGDTPPRREPDVSFVVAARLPLNLRITADFAPDLAAEVVSESDSLFDLENKILQYQKAGVNLVWIIRPVSKTVEVYETNQKPVLLTINDNLDGANVVPGFQLPITRLFE